MARDPKLDPRPGDCLLIDGKSALVNWRQSDDDEVRYLVADGSMYISRLVHWQQLTANATVLYVSGSDSADAAPSDSKPEKKKRT